MANDDKFIVTTEWQKVEANGAPVTNGTFILFAINDNKVEVLKSDTLPDQAEIGASHLRLKRHSIPYTLISMEFLYVRTGHGTAMIGITETPPQM